MEVKKISDVEITPIIKKEDGGNPDLDERENIFEFIRRVSAQQFLLVASTKTHLKKREHQLMKSAWDRVAIGLILDKKIATGRACQIRWKRLRDYYIRKKRSGKRKWLYYSAMDAALKNVPNNGSTISENIETKPIKGSKEVEEQEKQIQVSELISRVASHPILHVCQSREKNETALVNKTWRQVAKGLILENKVATGKACQLKWRSLRDYYFRVQKRKRRSGRISRWVHFAAMHDILKNESESNENDREYSNLELEKTEMDERDPGKVPLSPESVQFHFEPFPEHSAAEIEFGVQHSCQRKCLLCLNQTSSETEFRSNVLQANTRVIFIFKILLGVSDKELLSFFADSNGDDPCKWIDICDSCATLIESAELIHKQIVNLERTMNEFKRKCSKKVWDSCGCGEKDRDNMCSVCLKLSCDCSTDQMVTRIVRNSVVKKNSSPKNCVDTERDCVFEAGSGDIVIPKMELDEPINEECEFSSAAEIIDFDNVLIDSPGFEIGSERLSNLDAVTWSFNDHHDNDSVSIRSSNGQNLSSRPAATQKYLRKVKRKRRPNKTANNARHANKDEDDDNNASESTNNSQMYQCPSCSHLSTMNLDFFILHIIFHFRHPNKCLECNMYLPTTPLLIDRHWKEYHSDLGPAALTEKVKVVPFYPGEIWFCKDCELSFSSISDRDLHEKDVHNLDMAKEKVCNVCSMKFRNMSEVRLHKAVEHPEHAELCCTYCDASFEATSTEGIKFRHGRQLLDHRIAKHPNTSILEVCYLCGQVFPLSKDLQEHLTTQHKVHVSLQSTCHICFKRMLPKDLKRHIYETHTPGPTCEICGKTCHRRLFNHHMYTEHGKIMPGTKVYKCQNEDCSYETTILGRLNWHKKRFHSGEDTKEHSCQYCGKAFTKKYHMKIHEQIHTNASSKPYICDVCGARFPVRNYLYTHRRVMHLKTWHYKSKRKSKQKT